MSRLPAVGAVLALFGMAACHKIPADPLQLAHGLLTVDNRTADEWRGVEIWLNQSFRATAPSIAAGSRMQLPLDTFVSGYGQRFDSVHTILRDVRLAATTPQGTAVSLRKELQKSGLAPLGGSKP